ncbi:class Ib ribonucleoside-diphosphate reductase assembly flavoprotein NrdI [Staphylococcus gallinarum]|uniref:class Ib ribonucleoside-diphosphate reductase assembly flavoprotein NrdI n=1 Tax=Staphylococcus gallinarum TaxID=1293 RepID=UPI0030BAB986
MYFYTLHIGNTYILFGGIPQEVKEFLDYHSSGMIAVMSSGNSNWGDNFAKSGEIISETYKVELIGKFELAGTEKDVDKLIGYINNSIRNKV